MKMRAILILVSLISTLTGSGVATEGGIRKEPSDFVKRTGGYVTAPDPGNGYVAIANTQEKVPGKVFRGIKFALLNSVKTPVIVTNVPWTADMSIDKFGARLLLSVTDDPSVKSVLLIAPDEHWARVNISPLNADNPGQQVLESRVRKAVVRAFCFLCGGASSEYANSLVGPFKDQVKDYDRFPDASIPPDVYSNMMSYLRTLGVRPVNRATYENACQEGWAPAPKNEYQRAIWEKVHAPPTKPLKISYDKDKQKPVVK